jgi:hypothetical protein
VTFDHDSPTKYPTDQRAVGSGWSALEALSQQDLDERLPASYSPVVLADLALIEGRLLRKHVGTTLALHAEGRRDILQTMDIRHNEHVPFRCHFELGYRSRLRKLLETQSRSRQLIEVPSLEVEIPAAADVAADRTLKSAVATMIAKLSSTRFGRVPIDEMDLLWQARSALTRHRDVAMTTGILRSMAEVFTRSPDAGMRRVGATLRLRQAIVEEDDVDDDLLDALAELDGKEVQP